MMTQKSIFISLCSLLLAACSGDNQDLREYIQQVKQRKTRAIEPLPVFASLPGFKFSADKNTRNPFKASNQQKRIALLVPDQHRVKQALEVYPLATLKFVGTLTQDGRTWGLIKQPDSQITHVGIGDYMGQNYGRIRSITNHSIKLEETINGSSGAWEKHLTTLNLYTGM